MSDGPTAGDAGTVRWARVSALFRDALDRPPASWEDFVRSESGDDVELANEVLALLRVHATTDDGFLAVLDARRAEALIGAEADAPTHGSRIGPYIVERVLGRGGMAVVYVARDPRLERDVALKLVTPGLDASPEARRRLIAEARAVAAVDHPNIATVYDIGEADDGRVYFAMPRYAGETLKERIARGPLSVEEAIHLARQVAAGLAAAHTHGVVHRDVKPANVITTPDGVAKILDFGVAKAAAQELTRPGATLGTVAYMSPEQTRGEAVDARTDVWALGVLLYELLSGRRPFEGDDDAVVITRIRHDRHPGVGERRPDAPGWLCDVIDRCLEKAQADRFPDMASVVAALRGVGTGGAAHPGPETRTGSGATAALRPAATAPRRLRRTLRLAAGVGAAAAGVWLAGFLLDRNSAAPASTAHLLVLPFATSAPDSALDRLGTDLAITLARALDGVGSLRTVDPISVLSRVRRSAPSGVSGLATELGAGRVVQGTLVRAGADVRIDAVIRDASGGGTVVARANVTGPPDDVTGLTDQVAVALVRTLLRADPPRVPSVSALTTRSSTALRAYIEGEHAVAEGRFFEAAADFQRAIDEDPSFWFAYWRLWYARSWNDQPVDSAVVAAVAAHVDDFPEADALLARSRLAPTGEEQLRLLREATRLYPAQWQTWFDLGDRLHHNGPYSGFTQSDARAAFEAALQRNPDLLPALEHLFKIGVVQRDSVLTGRTLAHMTAMSADSLRAPELGYDILLYYRTLHHLTRSGGVPDGALADTGATMLASVRSRSHEELGRGLAFFGFGRAQIDLHDRIGRLQPAPDITQAHLYGRAVSWAQRGAWDSALVSARSFAAGAGSEGPETLPLQLAAVGAVLGVIAVDTAEALLEEAANRPPVGNASFPIELAWLQGLVAFANGDTASLGAARARLGELGGEPSASPLRVLVALEAAATGRQLEAALAIMDLERELASEPTYPRVLQRHPWMGGVSRLLASRWLLEAGDSAGAERLLAWYETMFPAWLRRPHDANVALSPFAMAQRARIAAARGDRDEAAYFWRYVLQMVDRPVPALGPLIEEARAASSVVPRSGP